MKNVFVWIVMFPIIWIVASCVSVEVPVPRTRPVVSEPNGVTLAPSSKPTSSPQPAEKKFFTQVELTIPITFPDGKGELNADVFRSDKKVLPKTLMIIVPEAGNISHHSAVMKANHGRAIS